MEILAFNPSHLCITLRLEPGKSLDKWRDGDSKSTLSTSECAMLWKQMSSALAYLHALNIIHDDVKPDNIMWCRDTQSGVLIDFGAAIVLPLGSYFNLSGTPNYAAPEYLDRRKSEKSDVWGLGITMIFALGYVPLPDGEWILPYALNEERSGHRKDMLAWLTTVETLRLELLESKPLIAEMLHAGPSRRIDSRQLSLQLEQKQEHSMEVLAAGQPPEDLVGSNLAS
ncbi:hypothetical protein KJ359_005915 [Pestalotiopsis sp. 9143b]|nr:hypothetical protein KJ359_005915 [Pestalotiopsis sp. 9143b]